MSLIKRQRVILGLGLPIIAGMLSQSVLNLIDAALVGQLGEASLAGVGIGSYTNFVVISLILGLSSAVQTLVARAKGSGDQDGAVIPVYWGLLLSLVIALPLSIFFISVSTELTGMLTDDTAVQDIAVSYFDYRTAAMVAVGLNLSFRGWWNGNKRPVTYFKVLLFTHILNVIVSYCLIFGELGLPRMGAPGAGLGSAIALFAGAFFNMWLLREDLKTSRTDVLNRIQHYSLTRFFRLALPHSLQQLFLALAICMLFWIIGQLGTNEQAIAHVLINLTLFLILPAVGFGVAATSLVSHSLGEGKPTDAIRWGWDVVKTAFAMVFILSLPLLCFPEFVLGLFLHSDTIIEQAKLPLQLAAVAICLDAATIVLTQALLGVGANRTVLMLSTLGQWCIFLPLAWLFGPALGFGLLGIWLVQVFYRSFSSFMFMRIWAQQGWLNIRI